MPIDTRYLQELIELLQGDSDARSRLRQVLLPEASIEGRLDAIDRRLDEQTRTWDARFAALTEQVSELAAAQTRTDQRLAELAAAQTRTDQRLSELAAAHTRTDQRLEALTERVTELAEKLAALTEKLAALTEKVAALTEKVEALTEKLAALTEKVEALVDAQLRTEATVRRMAGQLGRLLGRELESRYRDRPHAFFGRLLRRPRVVDPTELLDEVEGEWTTDELTDFLLVDVLVAGPLRDRPEAGEVWVALEVSNVVDAGDVERVRRRAALLARTGRTVVPAVAGTRLAQGVEPGLPAAGLVWFENGRSHGWESAVDRALGNAKGPSAND
jgi:uncharacterized coiled-coil protein SlyX